MASSKKVSKTYSIESDIWNKFKEITDKKFINSSRLIEEWIKGFNKENEEEENAMPSKVEATQVK